MYQGLLKVKVQKAKGSNIQYNEFAYYRIRVDIRFCP